MSVPKSRPRTAAFIAGRKVERRRSRVGRRGWRWGAMVVGDGLFVVAKFQWQEVCVALR